MNQTKRLKNLTIATQEEVFSAIRSFDRNRLTRILAVSKILEDKLKEHSQKTQPSSLPRSKSPLLLGAIALQFTNQGVAGLKEMMAIHDACAGLETLLGKVSEDIVCMYGWEKVPSKSHTMLSEIDCMKRSENGVSLSCIKSGPLCINDTTANRIGTAISEYCLQWGEHFDTKRIDFTVGMTYGTNRQSNKKNWHAIRIAEEKLKDQGATIVKSCSRFKHATNFYAIHQGLHLLVRTCVGKGFWDVISKPDTDSHLEICCALSKVIRNNRPDLTKDWVMYFLEGFADQVVYESETCVSP